MAPPAVDVALVCVGCRGEPTTVAELAEAARRTAGVCGALISVDVVAAATILSLVATDFEVDEYGFRTIQVQSTSLTGEEWGKGLQAKALARGWD